jgi:hypothetical protein
MVGSMPLNVIIFDPFGPEGGTPKLLLKWDEGDS